MERICWSCRTSNRKRHCSIAYQVNEVTVPLKGHTKVMPSSTADGGASVDCIRCRTRTHDACTYVAERLRIKNIFVRLFLAEFLGTCIMIIFGCGSVAQATLSHNELGSTLSINLAWGWAVSMAIWAVGGVSGAQLNPSITLTLVVLGKVRAIELPVYWLAQYTGAFAGAACIYGVYYDALNAYDGGVRSVLGDNATAGIFATYPQPYLSIASGFGDQTLGTAILVTCVLAIGDNRNIGAPNGLAPLAVGGLVAVIGMALGLNCGYAINPARDLGPRLFTLIAGWGTEPFTAYNSWWWVPVVAPHVGALCGALIYTLFVSLHMTSSSFSSSSGEQQSPKNGKISTGETVIVAVDDKHGHVEK